MSTMTASLPQSRMTFALVGAGFWAQYQLAAWGEVDNVQCVALVDRKLDRAQALADRFGIANCYATIDAMFDEHHPHFVDIVTTVETHSELVLAAASQKTHVICQKPLADRPDLAAEMVQACRQAGVTLSVHENWRWQRPIRELKALLDQQLIGKVFRATLNYNNSFPVFDNQPNLKKLENFILSDMGTHLFDVVRFLFGEPQRLYCQSNRSREDIRGEDVASTLMQMSDGLSVSCNMSYASRLEHDRFPETRLLIEGTAGTIELDDDYWISITTSNGTVRRRYSPAYYPWVDSRYSIVHSSMVDCQRHLLDSIRTQSESETSGRDNLKTLAMIDAAYRSARSGQVAELLASPEPVYTDQRVEQR